MNRRLVVSLIVGISLAIFLVWSLPQVPLAEIETVLAHLSPVLIFVLLLVNLGIIFLFSSRGWFILQALDTLQPGSQPSSRPRQGLLRVILALTIYRLGAFGVSYFTPGSQFGGEPLQIYLLHSRQKISTAGATAAVALERLLDLMANFTFLLAGLLLAVQNGLLEGITPLSAFLGVAWLLGLPVLYLLALGRGRLPFSWVAARVKRPGWLPQTRMRWLDQAGRVMAASERQIAALLRYQPQFVGAAFLFTGLIWVVMLFEYWLMLAFLGVQFTPAQAVIALTAARLAFLIPLPGGLGALEASQVLAFGAFGLHQAVGLSASLLIRGRDLLFGGLGLWLVGILLGQGPWKALSLPRDRELVLLKEGLGDESYSNSKPNQSANVSRRHRSADPGYGRDPLLAAVPQPDIHPQRPGVPGVVSRLPPPDSGLA